MPPCVHGSENVAVVGSALELGDNDDDESVGGNAIVQREDCVVSLLITRLPLRKRTMRRIPALRSSSGTVCEFGQGAPERSFTQPEVVTPNEVVSPGLRSNELRTRLLKEHREPIMI